jgi:hypothetical protein
MILHIKNWFGKCYYSHLKGMNHDEELTIPELEEELNDFHAKTTKITL